MQNETTIYCDSAHFYKSRNSLEAFGNVRIEDGDSVTVTARRLSYDGDTKHAKLRQNVVFTKLATATLYTDNLDYLRPTNLAYYHDGGKLVDSINVLTSERGYYNTITNMATFKKNVKVVNPDYTMLSDSIKYNTQTKVVYFITTTTVIDREGGRFTYAGGKYNTLTKTSDFVSGVGESEEYIIEGLKYELDATRNIYKVRGNVVMTSKLENLIIYGQASDHYKNEGITKVYNKAYVAKITEDNDTLFLTADTLVAVDNPDPEKRRLLAYNQVKVFKTNLQGRADSLEYRASDSTIYFYNDPVLWSEGNQLTADSIRMLVQNNTIRRIFLISNAFAISQDTLLNFNQVKGRKMTAEVTDSHINRVFVEGNAESIYFGLEEDGQSFMAMNHILCSSITMRFREGKVNTISFYVNPEGKLIPPHELKKEDMTLRNFRWRADEKPDKAEVVHKKP